MDNLMEKIISLSKRKGFIFQSSEIYGGFSSCYDFGPLGVELKNNIKKAWWDEMTKKQEDIVGLDASILMNPKVWEASGHLSAGFADELVECKKCHHRFRVDTFWTPAQIDIAPKLGIPPEERKKYTKGHDKCPECGGELSEPRKFNLMMKTFVGPVEDETATTYLRPETCQGIYMNFQNVLNSMRMKIPFGIAQIGKAFRNEITPKDFIYRMREFEQMEMQWFCDPKDANKFFDFWLKKRFKWYIDLGINKNNLRKYEVPKKELAHYAKRAVDIEYNFPFGWQEIEGIHNRGDWDLSNHSKHSGQDLKYEGYCPNVIETSVGVDRSLFAFLTDAYSEVKGGRTKTTKAAKEVETVLKLDRSLAPIKVAVLPLVKNKPELVKKAKEVYKMLKPNFVTQYDETGAIGRRYRRQDEIGTPACVTVDFDTLKKNDVTVRNRDTMKQERIKIEDLIFYLCSKKPLLKTD